MLGAFGRKESNTGVMECLLFTPEQGAFSVIPFVVTRTLRGSEG